MYKLMIVLTATAALAPQTPVETAPTDGDLATLALPETLIAAGDIPPSRRDRVVSHLRFTGHFTGVFKESKGRGQPIDFIATDILAVRAGKITDNWHLEDNLTFLQQIGLAAR